MNKKHVNLSIIRNTWCEYLNAISSFNYTVHTNNITFTDLFWCYDFVGSSFSLVGFMRWPGFEKILLLSLDESLDETLRNVLKKPSYQPCCLWLLQLYTNIPMKMLRLLQDTKLLRSFIYFCLLDLILFQCILLIFLQFPFDCH